MRTPGTWEAVGNFVRTTRDSNGVGGYEVAECPIGAGNGHDDARLIAAAPDMYEALKHEAEWHESEARTHKTLAQRNPGMVYDGLKEAWHRERAASLRAVLVKAEGKS